MKKMLFLMIFIYLVSCNDNGTNNSSDKTVIEKSFAPSGSQQSLESTDGIRIIIPGGALNDSLGIKLVKLANPPKLSSTTLTLGTNIFKLSFSGKLNLNKAIEIRVRYDKSKINKDFTPSNGVKGMLYSNNKWEETDYVIDESKEEILFNMTPISGKVSKFNDKLLENPEIIFGDAYTTTDNGNNDSPFIKFDLLFLGIVFDLTYNDGEVSNINSWIFDYSVDKNSKIKWNGNIFTTRVEKIVPKDWIKDYPSLPDSLIQIVSGELRKDNDGATLVKLNFDEYNVQRTYYGPDRDPDLKVTSHSFVIENLKLSYPDPKYFPDSYPFADVFGLDAGKYITKLNCTSYSRCWSLSKGDFEIIDKKLISFSFNKDNSSLSIDFYKSTK